MVVDEFEVGEYVWVVVFFVVGESVVFGFVIVVEWCGFFVGCGWCGICGLVIGMFCWLFG